MPGKHLTKVEFFMQTDDVALLRRFAADRGTTVAELIRAALYAQYAPLAAQDRARWARVAQLVNDEKALATWTGKGGS